MSGYLLGMAAMALLLMLLRELRRALASTRVGKPDQRAIDAAVKAAMKTAGATPERPLVVSSASLVEAEATTLPCVVCGEAVIAADHTVDTTGAEPLRVVEVHCRRCGHRRPVYVRIERDLVH